MVRAVAEQIRDHEQEPARVVAAVQGLLDCAEPIGDARRRGMGVAFGLLARWNVAVARGLQPAIFGPVDSGCASVGWQAWLQWSNPLLPAADLLRPRYRAAVDRLEAGAPPAAGVDPLDCTFRLGVHLLLLDVLAEREVSDFSGLAERFLLEADVERVPAALRSAALAASRALEITALQRLDRLLERASTSTRATTGRAALLRFGPQVPPPPRQWVREGLAP